MTAAAQVGAASRESASASDQYREADVITSAGPARGLSRCLSRMRGNSHVRFLGGRAGANPPGYRPAHEKRLWPQLIYRSSGHALL
jgi:hypothetical protein